MSFNRLKYDCDSAKEELQRREAVGNYWLEPKVHTNTLFNGNATNFEAKTLIEAESEIINIKYPSTKSNRRQDHREYKQYEEKLKNRPHVDQWWMKDSRLDNPIDDYREMDTFDYHLDPHNIDASCLPVGVFLPKLEASSRLLFKFNQDLKTHELALKEEKIKLDPSFLPNRQCSDNKCQ